MTFCLVPGARLFVPRPGRRHAAAVWPPGGSGDSFAWCPTGDRRREHPRRMISPLEEFAIVAVSALALGRDSYRIHYGCLRTAG